jgi:hypothetical protein
MSVRQGMRENANDWRMTASMTMSSPSARRILPNIDSIREFKVLTPITRAHGSRGA